MKQLAAIFLMALTLTISACGESYQGTRSGYDSPGFTPEETKYEYTPPYSFCIVIWSVVMGGCTIDEGDQREAMSVDLRSALAQSDCIRENVAPYIIKGQILPYKDLIKFEAVCEQKKVFNQQELLEANKFELPK